jgi:exopolysaccharide production protein ExoQ
MRGAQAFPIQASVSMPAYPPPNAHHTHATGRTISVIWCTFVVSVTVMLLGNYSGTIGAYTFLLLWIMLAFARMKPSLRALTLGWQIWLFPAFAVLSCAWSQQHWISLRFALEYAATVGCAVLAARLMSPRQVISALLICLLFVSVLCLVIGKSTFNQMTETVDFVGVFESKNELAFFVSLMLLASGAVLLDSGQGWPIRLVALVSLGPVLPLLVKTHSATAKVTAVLSLAVLVGNLCFARLTPRERARLLVAGLAIVLPLLFLLADAGEIANDFVTHVLGRSGTMTGRTVLWADALQLIPSHPLFGWGWQAFWVRSTPDAEGLWAQFHIISRQGFQFQNSFLETAIELGWIGCGLLCVVLAITLWRVVRWSWQDRSAASSFYVALMICFLIRAVVEVDILYQFSIGAFMFFVTMCLAFDRGKSTPRRSAYDVTTRAITMSLDSGAAATLGRG